MSSVDRGPVASGAAAAPQELEQVCILFSGDSGDGMQLTGTQFSATSAVFGNDVSTLPDFPAEIRAPAGSLGGVSAFQLSFASHELHTPGDAVQVLVAMNPAALKVYLPRLAAGGILIANSDAFTAGNLKKADYATNPLEDPELSQRVRVYAVPMTTLTMNALAEVALDRRAKERCKNFFTLGLLYWLYSRPMESTREWIRQKFARVPAVQQANALTLEAGYHYGETAGALDVHFQVPRARTAPGTYRIINGNQALALGLATAARLAGKPLVYSSYPITPASDVLQDLARLRHLDVRTLQLEDEIASMGSTIGAAFGGALAVTGTSGPGVCLKSEAINLAVMLELPMVIINVQRGGPSTGLPTKTEQADLLQALFGRNGESPLPVLAPRSPADCFDTVIEAFRIAVRHMTPVFLLSESFLANSAEPWRVPQVGELASMEVHHPTEADGFQPYGRDPQTLARPWAIPGTPRLEHCLGGLEKADLTGQVSYDPDNHERMCRLRAEKIERVADYLPDAAVAGPAAGELLVVSWGGSYGAVLTAVEQLQAQGKSVAHLHLRHLNPFPRNLGELLGAYRKVVVAELNFGQLAWVLRARYLRDVQSFSKVKGKPFMVAEIVDACQELLS